MKLHVYASLDLFSVSIESLIRDAEVYFHDTEHSAIIEQVLQKMCFGSEFRIIRVVIVASYAVYSFSFLSRAVENIVL